MLVICISGIDGSGKTTQLRLLYNNLSKRGIKIRYLHFRWFALFSWSIYLYAKLLRRTIIIKTAIRPVYIHIFWIDAALRKIYPQTLMLDLLIWFLINKLLCFITNTKILLLDRGFIDTLIDLIWEVRSTRFLKSIVVKCVIGLLKSFKKIIFDIDLTTAIKRKHDLISLKEIAFKQKCFKIFAKYLDIPVIHTSNRSITEIHKDVLEKTKALCNMGRHAYP